MIIDIEQWDSLSKDEQSKVTVINSKGTKLLSNIKDRPTMTFATMCKNEEEVIDSTLTTFLPAMDYLVFVDTTSTDNTVGVVVEFLKRTGIPGEIHIDEWLDMGLSKSKMMQYAYKKTDYLLHVDSHMHLKGNFKFKFKDEGFTSYSLEQRRGSAIFPATCILKNDLIWRFVGVRHTVLVCDDKKDLRMGNISDCYIQHGGNGRMGKASYNPDKYKNDAGLLMDKFWKTVVDDPDGIMRRSVFYAAQSWHDYGSHENAIKWYSLYTQLKNTWFEEVYISYIRMAYNMIESEVEYSFRQIEDKFIKAMNLCPDRAEVYFDLGKFYLSETYYTDAYRILKKGKGLSMKNAVNKYKLFTNKLKYEKYFNDNLSVACYYLNKKKEGLDLIKEIYDLPEFIRLRKHFDSNIEWLNKL